MNEERVARLEKRVRNLQLYALGATALVVAGASGPRTARYDVVHARQFVVLDENGTSRAVLGMQVDREEQTAFTERGNVKIPTEEAFVALRLEGPDERIELVVGEERGAAVSISEEGGRWQSRFHGSGIEIEYEEDDGDDEHSAYAEFTPGGVVLEQESSEEDVERGSRFALELDHGFSLQQEADLRGETPRKWSWLCSLVFDDAEAPRPSIEDAGAKKVFFSAPGD